MMALLLLMFTVLPSGVGVRVGKVNFFAVYYYFDPLQQSEGFVKNLEALERYKERAKVSVRAYTIYGPKRVNALKEILRTYKQRDISFSFSFERQFPKILEYVPAFVFQTDKGLYIYYGDVLFNVAFSQFLQDVQGGVK